MFMKILGVDSTATAASAAVYADGKLLAVDFSNTGLTFLGWLQGLLPQVCDKNIRLCSFAKAKHLS